MMIDQSEQMMDYYRAGLMWAACEQAHGSQAERALEVK